MKTVFYFILAAFLTSVLVIHTGTVSSENAVKKASAEQNLPELVLQTGHNESVKAVVFGSDNKWIASGSSDSTIIIWDFETGRELRRLTGHTKSINSLSSSEGKRLLASGSTDKTVKIWNVETGEDLYTFKGHNGSVQSVVFSSDGRLLAAGGADNNVIIWDVESRSELFNFFSQNNGITSLTFSPDGKFLASAGGDNVIQIRDLKTGKIKNLKNHTNRINALEFGSDAKQLASGAADKTIRIWDVSKEREIAVFKDHASEVLTVRFAPSGGLMSADAGQTIKYWDAAKPGQAIRSTNVKSRSDFDYKPQAARFSSDGLYLTVGNGDRTAAVFKTDTGEQLHSFKNEVAGFYGIAFSSDDRWLAGARNDGTIKLWDLKSGQGIPSLTGHNAYVTSVAFHPDNEHRNLISASTDGTIKIWNLDAGEEPLTLKKTESYENSIAVSKRWLVSGGSDKAVKLWNWQTKNEVHTFADHKEEVTSVAISPDERIIASGSRDKTIKLWDISTKSLIRSLNNDTGEIETITFSPDRKMLAAGGADKTVKIWDVNIGQPSQALPTYSGKIHTLSFSPDGKWLAVGGQDKTVRLWNVLLRREERAMNEHSGTVYSLAFSSNARWVISASADGSSIIWNRETGKSLSTIVSLNGTNEWLVVTPGGYFDGSPSGWSQLLWRFKKNTFDFKSVDVFFNEFYRPGLLSELLTKGEISTVNSISSKDRRQPRVEISIPDERAEKQNSVITSSSREIKVKIKVTEAAADEANRSGGGARDVRLFRNGSLVEFWENSVLSENSNSAELEAIVPLVYGENKLTAYAFNNDNIKSKDFTATVRGAENLKRKGILYIIGVAVSKYSYPQFNLDYIESDAQEFGEQLKFRQGELSQFEDIKIIPLINEYATKANILAALKHLSRNNGESATQKLPPYFAGIKPAQPEDTVAIYFSGHGKSYEGRFYMIPQDIGFEDDPDLTKDVMKAILKRSVSDLDLQKAVGEIDANRLLLIIDACNSGQAIEAEDKRQGPMNNKGLAQLAFDKGMYILTASQSTEDAYVSELLQRSYLTYTLVEEGLKKSFLADSSPKDGKVSLREWMDYATARVPQLREKAISGELGKGVKEKIAARQNEKDETQSVFQRPRAFYRRETEPQPMVIARVPAAPQRMAVTK